MVAGLLEAWFRARRLSPSHDSRTCSCPRSPERRRPRNPAPAS